MIRGVLAEMFLRVIAAAFVISASHFLGKTIQKIRYGDTDEPIQGGEGIGLVAFVVLLFTVISVTDLLLGYFGVADLVFLGAVLVFSVIAFIRIRNARRKKEEKQQADDPGDD